MKLSRLLAVPAVALAAGLASAFVATPAHAAVLDQACTPKTPIYHACLTAASTSILNEYKITAGLDSFMPQWYAQQIIDGGGTFWAHLYADDPGSNDTHVAEMPLAWVSAGPEGLGQEHVIWLGCSKLNEDSGVDEFYADISWRDPHSGVVTTRRTAVLEHDFKCWTPVP